MTSPGEGTVSPFVINLAPISLVLVRIFSTTFLGITSESSIFNKLLCCILQIFALIGVVVVTFVDMVVFVIL